MRAFVLLMLLSLQACAQDHNVEFTARKSYEEMRITWTVVDDVVAACNTMMYKKQFNPHVKACAQRSGITCEIITERNLDLAILGHEIRHCYEGAWHE
jgi:uncharacterized lipoprotein YehR (DUF1307 family)